MRPWLAIAILAVLSVSQVPVALGAPVSTTLWIEKVEVTGLPLAPEVGKGTLTIHWTYAAKEAGGNAVLAAQRTATLTWQNIQCEGLSGQVAFTGESAQSIDLWPGYPTTPPPASIKGTSTFIVTADRNAPGEKDIVCTTSGKVSSPQANAVSDSNEAKADILVTVQYSPFVTAKVPAAMQEAGPQKTLRFDVDLSNYSNSQTVFRFELRGDAPAGWLPVVPAPIILDSMHHGGQKTQDTVPFVIATPHKEGWNNDEATFQLAVTPVSTKDATLQGETIVVNLLGRVRGYYCSSVEGCEQAVAEMERDCQVTQAECEEMAGKVEALLADEDAKSSPGAGVLAGVALLGAAVALRRRSPR